VIVYHYCNMNPFFGNDEQAEAARQAIARGDHPEPAFTVLRPSNEQHQERKPVVWLTSEANADRGRVSGNPLIVYVRIAVCVKSTDRRLIRARKVWRRWQATHAGEPYPGDPLLFDRGVRHWWAYDGEIPHPAWRGFEIVVGGGAWWWDYEDEEKETA
jgi:hypothetical protein